MSEMIRVYVGARTGEVPPGSTLLDAVRAIEPDSASLVESGEKLIADSRGLPVAPDQRAYHGVILRVVSNRTVKAPDRDGGAAP